MSEVVLTGVTKRFGDVTALDDVSIHVREGEFFCVLGPPGAGKTTLLRTIIGLEQPERGTVQIAGADVREVPPGRRNCAIVFQNLALYPDKSVYDNLAFPLRQQKPAPKKAEVDERVREAARILRIEPLLARKPAKLSGGERQRVAIGRCLVRHPQVYLLDEPLSALDALLRIEMRAELKHLQRDLSRTMVYVTHDQIEAMSMADRICVLGHGRVQQIAPPETVYNSPANTFVATTVGTTPMNLIPVTATARDGGVELAAASFALRGGFELPSGPASFGARPEDVTIGGSGPLARVIAVEPLGGETIVDLELDGHIVKAMLPPGTAPAPDELVPIGFDLARVHVFGGDGDSLYQASAGARLELEATGAVT
jgi:multiple sugar transport system ATP-binding protein